jgi:hypothetical protein
MAVDGNREVRAMLFTMLHLTPLPVIVNRMDSEDGRVLSDAAVTTSFDLIANLIEWMTAMDNPRENHKRMHRQMQAHKDFCDDISKLNTTDPPERIYNFYCRHTLAWIHCYSQSLTVHFMPADYVINGDKTHAIMLDYAKGHRHWQTDGKELWILSDNLSYLHMLRQCAVWERDWNNEMNTETELSELQFPLDDIAQRDTEMALSKECDLIYPKQSDPGRVVSGAE